MSNLLTEKGIINLLTEFSWDTNKQGLIIGDNSAVIPKNKDESYLIAKGMLVEDVHFRLNYFTPAQLAYKTIHVNLSDIAAMGGDIEFILVGLSVPSYIDSLYIVDFLNELKSISASLGITILGGDTTKSEKGLFISITTIGSINSKKIKYKNKAKAEDIICVTGPLGLARAGLKALEENIANFEELKLRQLKPQARLKEGKFLASFSYVRSMIDISDGLNADLHNLCAASGVGAEIKLKNIPVTDILKSFAEYLDPVQNAIIGGEDYELMFTLPKNRLKQLRDLFYQEFGYEFYQIGKITEQKEIKYLYLNKEIKLNLDDFSHF